MLKRVSIFHPWRECASLSRTWMTWFTVGNGVLFGLYLGLYAANWEIPALIGAIGWGIGLASGLIVLSDESRWGEDGCSS